MVRWVMKSLAAAVVAVGAFAAAPTPVAAGEMVAFQGSYAPGTIVIRTGQRKLYYVMGGGRALRYPVAVGQPGRVWRGSTQIVRKAVNPVWGVPSEIRRLSGLMSSTTASTFSLTDTTLEG